jgi:hypothetical protein
MIVCDLLIRVSIFVGFADSSDTCHSTRRSDTYYGPQKWIMGFHEGHEIHLISGDCGKGLIELVSRCAWVESVELIVEAYMLSNKQFE